MILIEKLIPKFNTPLEFNEYLNDFDYGLIYKGKVIEDPTPQDYDKKYSTEEYDEFFDNEVGICWDFVNAEKEYFYNNFDVDWVKTYYVELGNENLSTHTFLVYKESEFYYYFESSWKDYQGIYKFKSLDNLFNKVMNQMFEKYGKNPWQIFEYNTDDIDDNLSAGEFMDYIYNTGIVVSGTF